MRKSRIRERAADPSHDRWLVSYSDFVTLLFAFFVVLFASAYRDSHAIIRVSNSIHNGFQALGTYPGGPNKDAIAYGGKPTPAPVAPEPGTSPGTASGTTPAISQADIAELRRQLELAMGNELKNHEVEMNVTPEGFVISLKELGFFDSGQAQLLPGASVKIARIAQILRRRGLDLRVEGHSDNQPIHNAQFRSNWELSTARAMSVLMLLVDESGYDPKKVSVAGYGEFRPVADDSTPEGRRQNRRVDLVVLGSAQSPAPIH
jgi:chemotaxis protein MotB